MEYTVLSDQNVEVLLRDIRLAAKDNWTLVSCYCATEFGGTRHYAWMQRPKQKSRQEEAVDALQKDLNTMIGES